MSTSKSGFLCAATALVPELMTAGARPACAQSQEEFIVQFLGGTQAGARRAAAANAGAAVRTVFNGVAAAASPRRVKTAKT
jgi:hypothetical protein